MRRKQSEITDPKEIQRILAATPIGRLATAGSDGYPYITPVNFVFYQDCIYFHCAPQGEKLRNLERDPRVCFTVDIPLAYLDGGFDPNGCIKALHQFYHCVIIRGEAQVIPNGPLKLAALNALVTKTEGSAEHEPINAEMAGYKACKVVEIKPTSISAKSELHQSKPMETRAAVARYLAARNRPGDTYGDLALVISADNSPLRLSAYTIAERKHAQGTAPVYMYYFKWRSPARNGKLRSMHCMDIPFVFDHVDDFELMTGTGDARYALAQRMSEAWVSFARTGNPNHDTLPHWPAFTPAERTTMIFDTQCRAVDDPYGEERRALEAIRKRRAH